MRYYVEIYFGVNLFLSGVFYSDRDYFNSVLCLFFGFPIYLFLVIHEQVFVRLNKYFQISFYFKFYVLRMFRNESIRAMSIRNNASCFHQTKSIKDRIWRHALGLMNKANNYKP